MKCEGIGKITKVYNNYGIITTNSLSKKGEIEEIPFSITPNMIIEEDGKTYFNFHKNVNFTLKSTDGIRRQGRIYEIVNIKGTGEKIKVLRDFPTDIYVQKVIQRFDEYNFEFQNLKKLTDTGIYEQLKIYNFQPRMLNYLVNGIFLDRNILKNIIPDDIDIEQLRISPELIVGIDKIDQKFRLYLMEWILQIENSIKNYFSRISSDINAKEIVIRVMEKWKEKKGDKHFKTARKNKKFRKISNDYDYVLNKYVPIEDLMEQLDLSELQEFIQYWYEESQKGSIKFYSPQLERINDSIIFLKELSVLRNAAAHGKAILPGFMDPDYNANWELEFDFVEDRTKVNDWKLYPMLESYWLKLNVKKEYISTIIQTIFGNSFRRSWVTLNYLYMNLISILDQQAFSIFVEQATYFLKYPNNFEEHFNNLKNINMLNLRLFDMGPTTFENITGLPAPYKEIANEAFAIWRGYHE